MLDKSTVREIAANYTQVIRRTCSPKQVILFGSYVNGTPNAESDIDIAVVFEHVEGDFLEQWGRLIRLCENVSYDIEPHMLDESCNRSGFLEHIRSTGEVIFEA